MQIKISIHVKSWELFAEEINTDDFFSHSVVYQKNSHNVLSIERNKCECKELEQILSFEEWGREGTLQSITNDGDFVISMETFFLDFLQRSFPTFSIYSSIRSTLLYSRNNVHESLCVVWKWCQDYTSYFLQKWHHSRHHHRATMSAKSTKWKGMK